MVRAAEQARERAEQAEEAADEAEERADEAEELGDSAHELFADGDEPDGEAAGGWHDSWPGMPRPPGRPVPRGRPGSHGGPGSHGCPAAGTAWLAGHRAPLPVGPLRAAAGTPRGGTCPAPRAAPGTRPATSIVMRYWRERVSGPGLPPART